MNIVQYTPKLQSVLTEFYNRQTVNVPHCYPVKEEEFALAMRGVTTGKADIQEGGLDFETVLVAIENRAVQAFIHVGIGQVGDNRRTPVGVIRFLGYERGARRAGQGQCLKKRKPIWKRVTSPTLMPFHKTIGIVSIILKMLAYRTDLTMFKHSSDSTVINTVQERSS